MPEPVASTPLNILIVGAGIAGPALAAFLSQSTTHKITILERSPCLRLTGQQIDLKTHGLPLIKKLGIIDKVKAHAVIEKGMELIDSKGRSLMRFEHKDVGKGARVVKGVTSEIEIMRGDLVKVLVDATNGRENITYLYGNNVMKLDQTVEGVEVTLTNGERKVYDLVVGADGQNSATRRLAFGEEVSDAAYKFMGVYAAFFSIPRAEGDGDMGKSFITHGRRGMLTRTGDRPRTQVLFFTGENTAALQETSRGTVEQKKAVWAETMRGSGWQTERFLRELTSSPDLYDCDLAQVKVEHLYKGRIVLLGDAGYCPSVMTGMGTESALIGAYVLAGELSRHGRDVDGALKAYDELMSEPINEWQQMTFGPRNTWPASKFAVWLLQWALWSLSALRVDRVMQALMPNEDASNKKWAVPEYPEFAAKSQ